MGADGLGAAVAAARVLVVEDSDTARELLRRHLTDSGYSVESAIDGDAALVLARSDPPDLVLLDIELPGSLSGLDVLDRLRADPGLVHVPVIVVTNRDGRADVVAGLDRGAHDYLTKPVDLTELTARCAAAVRTKRLHDDLAELNTRLERDALTDELTGLANRRCALDDLRRMVAGARRHGRSPSVLLVDLDHFKAVNDSHGHAVGDQVLRETARRLEHALRAPDCVARYGGEEFIVLLDEVPTRQVALVADRLRRAIEGAPVRVGEVLVPITTSVGWAQWADEEAEALIDRADRALYEAKAAGRNAVHPLS